MKFHSTANSTNLKEGNYFNNKSLTFISIYMALSPTFSSKLLLCNRNNLIQQNMYIK